MKNTLGIAIVDSCLGFSGRAQIQAPCWVSTQCNSTHVDVTCRLFPTLTKVGLGTEVVQLLPCPMPKAPSFGLDADQVEPFQSPKGSRRSLWPEAQATDHFCFKRLAINDSHGGDTPTPRTIRSRNVAAIMDSRSALVIYIYRDDYRCMASWHHWHSITTGPGPSNGTIQAILFVTHCSPGTSTKQHSSGPGPNVFPSCILKSSFPNLLGRRGVGKALLFTGSTQIQYKP